MSKVTVNNVKVGDLADGEVEELAYIVQHVTMTQWQEVYSDYLSRNLDSGLEPR